MQNIPLVSVVMPVYNAEKYLSAAIESILNQTFGDFEFLIVNDGSGDGSGKIICRYANQDSRIRVLDNGGNKGIVCSLNRGMDEARGKYIARMDADDIAYADRLQMQVDYMEANLDISLLGTQIKIMNSERQTNVGCSPNVIRWQLLENNTLNHPTVMMRREDLIRKNIKYKKDYVSEDYKLWTDISAAGLYLANLPNVLLDYRVHDTQLTNVKRTEAENQLQTIRSEYARNLFGQELTNEEVRIITSSVADYTYSQIKELGSRLKLLNKGNPYLTDEGLEYYIDKKTQNLVKKVNFKSAFNYQKTIGDKVILWAMYIFRPLKKMMK